MDFAEGVVVDEDAADGEGCGAVIEAEVGGDVAAAEAGGGDVMGEGGGGEGFAEEVFVADEGAAGVEPDGGVEVGLVVAGVGVEADEDGVDVV